MEHKRIHQKKREMTRKRQAWAEGREPQSRMKVAERKEKAYLKRIFSECSRKDRLSEKNHSSDAVLFQESARRAGTVPCPDNRLLPADPTGTVAPTGTVTLTGMVVPNRTVVPVGSLLGTVIKYDYRQVLCYCFGGFRRSFDGSLDGSFTGSYLSSYLLSSYQLGSYLLGSYQLGSYLFGSYQLGSYLFGSYPGSYLPGSYPFGSYPGSDSSGSLFAEKGEGLGGYGLDLI